MTARRASILRFAGVATGLWLWRLAAALVLSAPWVDVARASGAAARAEGDAALFVDGGVLALDVLHRAEPALRAAAGTTLAGLAVVGLLGVLPLGAVIAAVARPGTRGFAACVAAAWVALPAQASIAAAAAIARAGLVVAGGAAALAVVPLTDGASEQSADLMRLAVLGIGLACASTVQVVADATRVANVAHALGPRAAIRGALGALGAQPGRVAAAWLGHTAAAACCASAGVALASRANVAEPAAWRVFAAWTAGQLALWGVAAVRVSWLQRLVAHTEPDPPAARGCAQAESPAADA